MQLETKKILKYTLTPQILPRVQSLFYSGFSYVAFFMAHTYRAVQLLPTGHPYLNPSNMGRFGVRHVIVEAGNNLVFKKENIDQIAIFTLLIIGMLLMICQLFMLFIAGFVEVAQAAPPNIFGAANLHASSTPLDFFTYFQTPQATHDIAFILLDRVFGIPGLSGAANTSFFTDAGGGYTCVAQGIPCFSSLPSSSSTRVFTPDRDFYTNVSATANHTLVPGGLTNLDFPWPYHEALRGMIQVYSVGLLVIGIFIFCYFIFAIAAETAQTGTAFGRRFNHLWAPIRIILAMGLLVPITYGLNPAQWILMYVAKWGSSFATNGWHKYNDAFSSDTLLGPAANVVATPGTPPLNTLMEFGSILATCKLAYERLYHDRPTRPAVQIDAWLVNSHNVSLTPVPLMSTSFVQAIDYFNRGTIHVRFGERSTATDRNQSWDGGVAPYCGELTLDLTYVPEDTSVTIANMTEPGSFEILFIYYALIRMIWGEITNNAGYIGMNSAFVGSPPLITFDEIGEAIADRHISVFNNEATDLPTNQELASLLKSYQDFVIQWINTSVADQRTSLEWTERLKELGWAGAAIWYNKVAQLNGGLVSAVYSLPTVKSYPLVMEKVRKMRAESDDGVSGETAHRVYRSTDDEIPLKDPKEKEIAKALFEAQVIWRENYSAMPVNSSPFIDAINAVFGTDGLFNIASNEAANVHPLAQLASIGRALVDSAVRNLGYSTAAGLGGGLANLFQHHQVGTFGGTTAKFFFQVAMIGLSVGFVLFYIIPFLPFIYFFFAVGGWIKSIFEAMVGVPLWALAHIRIDGQGLPGDAAMNGYYLILEIGLRPILIIFGFIASMLIFAAQVQVLHEIWTLVVSNVSGFDVAASGAAVAGTTGSIEYMRGAVDKLFFTVIYAILCYMMGMASFKLIDQVPNHILRWMGASVSTFGEQSGDPAENLVRNSFIGARMVSGPLSQAAGAASGAGKSGSAAMMGLFGKHGK